MLTGKIADIIAKAGHEVVVYQPVMDENITTTGSKLARVITRERDYEIGFNMMDAQADVWAMQEQSMSRMLSMVGKIRKLQVDNCHHQITDSKLMERLKSENFDLAVGEPFDACYYGVLARLGIDNYISILASSGFFNAFAGYFGIPSTPSFVPGMMSGPPPFTYFQKAKNFALNNFMGWWFQNNFIFPITEIVRKDLDENFDVMKYEEIFNSSKKGVILVSFGSVAQSYKMPEEVKKTFLETFAQFPDITFLWKYEKDEDNVALGYDNVITGNWLPQTDILAHPKLLAFISHGGMNSVMEASFAGVPLICIPLMADQFRNAQMAQYRKIGKKKVE
uniref:glucuronosyltransferase n=1 Tax=Acrobeloides nanus TaxID=290746 RepID=A0A914DB59_9BILA